MSFNKNKKIGQEAKRIAHSAESHGMSAVGWRKTAHDYGKAAAKSKASQKLKKMAKKARSIHVVGVGHGTVKGPENMKRNPVLSPKKK